MQHTFSKFAKDDYAKYPFLKEAAKYLKAPNLRIEDLANPEMREPLKRAEQRLEQAILTARVERRIENAENEIASYPIAIIIATATKNSFIQKRYATAEAKQTYENLKEENTEKILEFSRSFGWTLVRDETHVPATFALNFVDYLRNTTYLRDQKWKLTNRDLSKGQVYLTKIEVARLLSEEVRQHIEKRLEIKELPLFPPEINEIAERINKLAAERIGKVETEDYPKIVVQTDFPPCITALYQAFTSGRHLSHIGRFTLTSFLVNAGMSSEQVIELFRNISDFNERMTRYQVEHIAGEKGSKTRYMPPRCDTLKTHGVCVNPDELCRRVRHPLIYYKRKLRAPK